MANNISQSVAVVTTTSYNPTNEMDLIRIKLTEIALKATAEKGFSVYCIDKGSPDEFILELEKSGVKVIPEIKPSTMGSSKRQAINEGYKSGREVIVWSEPEKTEFLPAGLEAVVRPILKGDADIVIPSRKSFKGYPTIQVLAEKLGNEYWLHKTGKKLDMWFGPRAFAREQAHFFLDYSGKYGDKWEAVYIPVLDMINRNCKVLNVPVKYTHPSKQTSFEKMHSEFYAKRVEQLDNLVNAIERHLK